MISNIQNEIKEYLTQNNMSVVALEKKAGLKARAIRNILEGKSTKPSAQTVQAIAKALGYSIDAFLNKVNSDANVSTSTAPTQVKNLDLFLKTVKAVVHCLKAKQKKSITIGQLAPIIEDIYLFSLSKDPPEIDEDFVEWTITNEYGL